MINDIKPYVLVKNTDSDEISILTKEQWIANANSNLDEIAQYAILQSANTEGIMYARINKLKFIRRTY